MITDLRAGQDPRSANVDDLERGTPSLQANGPSAVGGPVSASLSTSSGLALVPANSIALELSLTTDAGDLMEDSDVNEGDLDVAPDLPPGNKHLSDAVIGLREWGTREVYPLRTPRDSRRGASPSQALQLARADLAIAPNRVELVYEDQSWRVKDRDGIARLKQDGRPTREANLVPGAEITIAGRTLIAESPRYIALRNFCARLLGWGDERIAVVDQALRAIRLASTGRAALVLRGSGDLVLVAHTIHRRMLGDDAPFVVSDPRRRNTPATVRSPANQPSGMAAFHQALQGTLCVRVRRLPPDFSEVSLALQVPDPGVQLTVCASGSTTPARDPLAFGVAQIDIPSLETRRAELPRIVSEYIEDAIHALHGPDDCLKPSDVEWIMSRASLANDLTIPDIEKTVLRMVALRLTGDRAKAARLLGMARVSLERWLRRRNGDTP